MFIFTCLLAIFCVAVLAHGLDATECVGESDLDRLRPTTSVLGALLSNKEYTVSDISRRSPPSNFTDDWEEELMMGSLVNPGGGDLIKRQSMCVDPGYVIMCSGPRPCCLPTYTVCCYALGGCCPTGDTCGPSGSTICCRPGASVCGIGCCPPSRCCGGTICCASGEMCDTVRGRCYDPIASALSSASVRSASLAAASPTPPPADDVPEFNIDLSQVQFDPPNAWSSTGVCLNGTRSTTQVQATFSFKFRGTKIATSFVPKEEGITVSVKLNGVTLDQFDIPRRSPVQCRLQNSWNKTLPDSANDHQLTFTYVSHTSQSSVGPPALELGQIRYQPGTLSPSASATSQGVRRNAAGHLVMVASAMVPLLMLLG